jgi:CspA family cold shock protein
MAGTEAVLLLGDTMKDWISVVECQRCRRGFLLTPTYRDWLARRGTKVIHPPLCPTCFMKAGPLPKRHGKVKWFNPRKHYGFIAAEEGEDIFFNQQQILGSNEVCKGQSVKFHVRDSMKGQVALNIELVGD